MGKQRGMLIALAFVMANVASFGVSAVSNQSEVFAPSQKILLATDSQDPNTDKQHNAKALAASTTKSPANTAPLSEQGITFTRENNRLIATDNTGWLATFTDGARTVSIRGAQRKFSESGVSATVTNNIWVRLLPSAFAGVVDDTWLQNALDDTSPDVLGTAMQYVTGSSPLYDVSGKQYAGDADYGPLNPDGTRQEGSDFNDYLGISYDYDGVTDTPEARQLNAMDCSGYMRMVWGYRLGIKLTNTADGRGLFLPRRAVQMYSSGPGMVVIAQGANAQSNLGLLIPGDLVFQDASTDDGTAIDHVGIYIGRDLAGNYRFVSSRKTANGPTIGDIGGKSILNGTGLYAKSFVAARRL